MMRLLMTWLVGLKLCFSLAVSMANGPTNLLLIMVDDLGYGDLGSFGHPIIQSPNLDRLAATGVRFTEYYSSSALCSPSRAALLTGRHPYRSGIRSWIPEHSGVYLREHEITLAELLQDKGYQTALIGKWHLNSDLGAVDEPQPNDQGFDYFYGHNAFQTPTNRNPNNLFRDRIKLPVQPGYTADLYARESINWLRDRRVDRPFFLMLSMAEPHTPIENPPEVNAIYASHTQGDVIPIPSGLAKPPKSLLTPRGPGEYFANVTYMDQGIGAVLDYLQTAGLRTSTLIVFVSDNGPVTDDWINWYEVNAYGSTAGYRGRKHFLYEGGIKVPAIMSLPGIIPENIVSDVMFTGTDWLATLGTLLDFKVPEDRPIDSVDVSAAVLNEAPVLLRAFHWALPTPNQHDYVIRQGAAKLMLDADHKPIAFFDLETDSLEMFNLISTRGAEVKTLTREHVRFFEAVMADPLRPALGRDQSGHE
ncbi:sulfatase-like hydrolase/transferase [bacterium]|jgi:arylsulfatase A-like enzyme|nr:sulfatase-like hydrolase/transferase [Pseudomonadales bacterium]MDC1238480.1 sulfatase-like hydrolase/transferase [Pseudomonadales bacterium]MDC1313926.1 sulfatase-like hydrolase/transferase [Pseudomonadales bacterium]MDC3304863.1 sulfatase-like hydrolase/transferase [bacterium]MDC3327485.1 sulfatase-like hydrolase/transferase [Pseudomonadales bacterium]